MDDLEELRGARARLASELVGGRRRLERSLHDTVQQELTALTVELQLAGERAAAEPAATAALLEELRRTVHATLDTVRSLAETVYPPLLDAGGLVAALPGAARLAGVHLRFTSRDNARAGPDAEAAVLFVCRSAFERLPQHTDVAVSLHRDGPLLRLGLEPVTEPLPAHERDLVEGAGGTVEHDGMRLVLSVYSSAR